MRGINRATVGTIIIVGVVSIVFFTLIATLIGDMLGVGNIVVGTTPREPVLAAIYTPLYTIYTYMKDVLSNNMTIAVLMAVSILLLALEMRWREEY